MNQLKKTYKRLLVVWLLMWGCLTSSAVTYQPATPPSAWSTTPTMSADIRPSYQFQSTSAYTPLMGQTRYSSTVYLPGATSPYSRPRKAYNPWSEEGDEEGNPQGQEVGVIDTPVGEPWIMLVLAALYIVYKRRKRLTDK